MTELVSFILSFRACGNDSRTSTKLVRTHQTHVFHFRELIESVVTDLIEIQVFAVTKTCEKGYRP